MIHDLTARMLDDWTTTHLKQERTLVEGQIASKQAFLAEINRVLESRERA